MLNATGRQRDEVSKGTRRRDRNPDTQHDCDETGLVVGILKRSIPSTGGFEDLDADGQGEHRRDDPRCERAPHLAIILQDQQMMGDFTIAAAQISSVGGDVSRNLAAHMDAVVAAASHNISALVFPELSLTGYEPDLAASLAFSVDDARVASLRRLAVEHRIALTVGAPVRTAADKPAIGAFILTPDGDARTYLKMHLGKSEVASFSPGEQPFTLDVDGHRLGISICADSSRESHAQTCRDLGAQIYAAGVFLTSEWYREDAPRLQKYAAKFGLLSVMANQAASGGTYESVGKSAIWAPGGDLLVQADGVERALVTATLGKTGWQGKLIHL